MKSLSPFASFALRFITLLTIIAAPWYLGGVTHGVHAAACLAGFAGLLLLLLLTRSPQSVFRVSPVELVLALTPILLVSLQLVPLPEEVLRFVAPAAANLRAQYSLAEVAPATISLAPAETRLFLSRCWLGIVFFLIGKWLGAFESKKFLLWTFVANGIVLAFFGIAHRLGGPHDLFWENTDPLRDGFGPFVNKNNAAGYLCATLAIAAWMIVVPKSDSLEYSDKTQSTAAVRSARFAMWIINMLVVSLLLTGVLFTLSRSAYIAVFFGFLAIIPIIARNLRQLTLIGTGLAFTALLLVWSGFQSGILERFRKIDSSELQMMRGLHWQDDVIMASDMWLGGCGMGAYRFVNRVYQTVPTDLWFMYSENQYLETLVSGGIFMLTALLVAIVLFLWRSWQLGAQHFDPTAKSIGVLGISLVVMQIVTASFDFALFHSSNLILVACLAGIVLGTQQKNAAIINGSTRITTMALVLLLSIGLFSTRESLAHANIESAMGGNAYRTIVGDGQRPESMGRLIRDIDGLKSALKYCADHPTGHARLANLYILRARYELYQQLVERVDESSAWTLTQPEYLLSRLVSAPGERAVIAESGTNRQVASNLRLGKQHMAQSNWSCPLLPRVHYRFGLADALLSAQAAPLDGVEDCLSIVTMHSKLHLSGGAVALLLGEDDKAIPWLRRGLQLSGELSPGLMRLVSEEWTIDYFITKVLNNDFELSWKFLRSCRNNAEWRNALCEHILELNNSERFDQESPVYACYVADVFATLGRTDEAAEVYRNTLNAIPDSQLVEFRFSFAKLLYRGGRLGEAFEQAEICVREMPWHKGAATLHQKLANDLRNGFLTQGQSKT